MNVIEIKAAIRKRDGHRCTKCGMTSAQHKEQHGRNLEVHRVVPGSSYAVDESCITICRTCHYSEPRREYGAAILDRSCLHPKLKKQLGILVERNCSSIREELAVAVREHLERNQLWPLPRDKP